MKAPKRIFTRQLALVEELGLDSSKVLTDGIDEFGIRLYGDFPELGVIRFASNEITTTHVPWPDDATRERGLKAREDDFNESFGITPS
jgi:hypothetical protein